MPDRLDEADGERADADHLTGAPAIELRHLRYFLAVFEELHFGRAAERLHIAQPPLSQAIRRLEQELGVQLFRRTSRVVTPTEAGRALASEAGTVLRSFDVAVAETRRAGGAVSMLRVGSVPDLPVNRLLAFLEVLEQELPSVRSQIRHLTGEEQIRSLRTGELDLALTYDIGAVPGIDHEPVFSGEPVAAFVPRGHPLAEQAMLAPADLEQETLVVVPRDANPSFSDQWLERIEAAGYRFRSVQEATGPTSRDLLLAVATGVGIALGAASLSEVSEVGSIVVRRDLREPFSMPATVAAWSSDPPRQLRANLEKVREAAVRLRLERG